MTKTEKKKKLKALSAKMNKQWEKYLKALDRASQLRKAYRKTWWAWLELETSK